MGARVPLLLRRASGSTLKSSCLLNTGFESGEPHLLLPRRAAEQLFPQFPAGTRAETIGTPESLAPIQKAFIENTASQCGE